MDFSRSTKVITTPVDPQRSEKTSLIFSVSEARVRPTAGRVAKAPLEMRHDGAQAPVFMVSSTLAPRLRTVALTPWPDFRPATTATRASNVSTSWPAKRTIRSPRRKPASADGPPRATSRTKTPPPPSNPRARATAGVMPCTCMPTKAASAANGILGGCLSAASRVGSAAAWGGGDVGSTDCWGAAPSSSRKSSRAPNMIAAPITTPPATDEILRTGDP